MTTLLAVYDSDGCVGRCDAKCYDATHAVCDCLCGGEHGADGRGATGPLAHGTRGCGAHGGGDATGAV